MLKKLSLFILVIVILVCLGTVLPENQAQANSGGYLLPWSEGLSAKVVTYAGHDNQVDFQIFNNNGDRFDGADILAAKAGTVVFVKEISPNPAVPCQIQSECQDLANVVVVKNDSDGYYSWYVHIKHNSVPVNLNDHVNAGAKIGEQGRTGWTLGDTGIHLHFMVTTSVPEWTDPNDEDEFPWPNGISRVPVDFVGVPWSRLPWGQKLSNPYDCGFEEDIVPVGLYSERGCNGTTKTFSETGFVSLGSFENSAKSISIKPGWSARVYQNPTSSWPNKCLIGSHSDLSDSSWFEDNIPPYLEGSISSIEVFHDMNCGYGIPVCPSSSQSSEQRVMAMDATTDDCVDPTPTPTPVPGVTPTPPPPNQTGVWSAKVFTSMNECNDSPDCNPTTTYYQTSVSGTNFNLNFPDGKAFGVGGDQWGMILRQTVNLAPGTYYLHADHDDGVKVWVNGEARMDVLGDTQNNHACPGVYLSGQTNLSILWKNTGGGARLNFSIDQNGGACESQQKWSVKYYHDPHICSSPNCDLQQVFCETEVPGAWFRIDPYPNGTPCDNGDQSWGSIWKQTIDFPEGDYVFWADHDDGVKVFLGDTNIMDLTVSEYGNKACPARHLSGNVPITVIHNNLGGDARINFSWSTDTSVCEQVAYNIWVWKDSSDQTHVTVENGDASKVNLYLARSGQQTEITRSLWYPVSGAIEAVIPGDVDSFLVDQGYVPTIGSGNEDEWYHFPSDNHWIVRKKMFVWIDEIGQTRLTYQGGSGSPNIRYYTVGSSELQTTSWWYATADGIEAIIPENVEAVKVDKWILPSVATAADSWWMEGGYWLPKKIITVNLLADGTTRVNYYRGSPLPVSLGRYGSELETRSDLWQSEVVDGNTNYFLILPPDVIAFMIAGGPRARIDDWATWMWGNYGVGHWVAEKTTWVYRNENNDTRVFYANPDVNPADVEVIYYLFGDSVEHRTTSWWTATDDGLMMSVPRDVEVFLLARGPAPLLTDSVIDEWKALAEDPLWIQRKPIRVWIDSWGKTYVTYWHQGLPLPQIHYVLNGQEIITTDLWTYVGDGIQARVPDGTTHLLIDVNNQPYIEASAATVWRFSSLPGLWMELINVPTPTPTSVPPTSTATAVPPTATTTLTPSPIAPTATWTPTVLPTSSSPTPTVTLTSTARPPTATPSPTMKPSNTPTASPTPSATPTPTAEYRIFLPIITLP